VARLRRRSFFVFASYLVLGRRLPASEKCPPPPHPLNFFRSARPKSWGCRPKPRWGSAPTPPVSPGMIRAPCPAAHSWLDCINARHCACTVRCALHTTLHCIYFPLHWGEGGVGGGGRRGKGRKGKATTQFSAASKIVGGPLKKTFAGRVNPLAKALFCAPGGKLMARLRRHGEAAAQRAPGLRCQRPGAPFRRPVLVLGRACSTTDGEATSHCVCVCCSCPRAQSGSAFLDTKTPPMWL
jgi:hypothetical protein